ncbi:MAG TPA: hypothetical protein VNF51_00475 [Candidatus Paceibacterota bacterium]|nr:hypothetical protein [Candidatus Paceibacterota bacterium]
MKLPDVDRLRSEKPIPFSDFLKFYNENLPAAFPRASLALLREFKKTNTALFKNGNLWSLDQHRKKVMDWLTSRQIRVEKGS